MRKRSCIAIGNASRRKQLPFSPERQFIAFFEIIVEHFISKTIFCSRDTVMQDFIVFKRGCVTPQSPNRTAFRRLLPALCAPCFELAGRHASKHDAERLKGMLEFLNIFAIFQMTVHYWCQTIAGMISLPEGERGPFLQPT